MVEQDVQNAIEYTKIMEHHTTMHDIGLRCNIHRDLQLYCHTCGRTLCTWENPVPKIPWTGNTREE